MLERMDPTDEASQAGGRRDAAVQAPLLAPTDPDAVELVAAITGGQPDRLRRALARRPHLARAAVGDAQQARSCLHLATDWPGHFPEVATTIRLLVAAGADVDAPFVGTHRERPLHWAASSGDLDALAALLDAGADAEADGGVLTGGPPLDDAVIFAMLDAARLLVAHGATTQLFHAAALGMTERLRELLTLDPVPQQDELDASLWHACRHGGQAAAAILLDAGADPAFAGFGGVSTRQAAEATGDTALVTLLG